MSVASASRTDGIVAKSVNGVLAPPRRGGRAALKLLMGAAVAGSAASAPIAATAATPKFTFSVLHSFGLGEDGQEPNHGVVYRDGAFYGAAGQGGTYAQGILYKFDIATGTETSLFSFKGGAGGSQPASDLVFIRGNLYGTTYSGGTGGKGTIFKLNKKTGKAPAQYSFQLAQDGGSPNDVMSVNGTLYGTCQLGAGGFGSVFKFDRTTRQLTVLHTFAGGNDGAGPHGNLVYVNGLLYGTTQAGGAGNGGTVYSLDPATGTETIIHTFSATGDGAHPQAALTYANGLLYGTTTAGGTKGEGTVFSVDPTTGQEVVLHSFSLYPDGSVPIGMLSYLHGHLYGTTSNGGIDQVNNGTIFKVDAATGATTTLHKFTGSVNDGGVPLSSLYLYKGKFYGTTAAGGRGGLGTIYAFTP